jgi:phage host-nuclease inhibitor protein Gam
MSKTRLKVTLPAISLTTRDAAEAAMNEIALATNNKRKLAAQRDKQVLEINAHFERDFAEADAYIAVRTDALRQWADAHPEAFAKGRKSIDFLSGILGYRTGTPKLALLNRAWNWDKVTDAVCGWLPNFIRNKPEVDKEALLAQRDEPIIKETLPRVGLKVVQEESFYIEPNLTAFEERHTQPVD